MWDHGLDRDGSGWGQVAGIGDCGYELRDSIHCGEILYNRKHVSFSRKTLLHGVIYRVNYVYIRNYADFRKACIRFVMAVHPSVHFEKLGPHWTDSKTKTDE